MVQSKTSPNKQIQNSDSKVQKNLPDDLDHLKSVERLTIERFIDNLEWDNNKDD